MGDEAAGITGVLGGAWRADVSSAGAVRPWDGSSALDWHIAADDRWHTPADEVAVRHERVAGAPVFETRVRIPGGDAVHRVWSVADGGGRTLVEVTNESPLPIACAFTRVDLLTVRPPAAVPIEGIDLPAATILLPISHRASVTVGLAHQRPAAGALPPGSASAAATARGWVNRAERASRVEVPDDRAAAVLVAARSDLLLAGPPDDPAGLLLAWHELVRLGELDAGTVIPDVATAVEAIARQPGWDVDAALAAAGALLSSAGERRGLADLGRIRTARPAADAPPDGARGVRAAAAVERLLAADGALFPHGIPASWRGQGIEAHGLPIGPASTVSFALRWHGVNAAVLWEVTGEPVALAAPAADAAWRTTERRGEALWLLSEARARPGGG